MKRTGRSLAVEGERIAQTVDNLREHGRKILRKVVPARVLEPEPVAIDFQDTDPWVRRERSPEIAHKLVDRVVLFERDLQVEREAKHALA